MRLGSMSTHTMFIDPKHDDAFSKLGKVCYTPMPGIRTVAFEE